MKLSEEEKTGAPSQREIASLPAGEAPPPQNRLQQPVWRNYLIVAGLFIALALIVIWLSSGRNKSEEEATEAATVSVRVAKAERGEIAAEVTALGTIFPREEATVSPKINAQIKQMALVTNKAVSAGEAVATLESRDIQAQRAEAAAALEEAQANARLLSGGTIPETTAQDEKALRDARANVANAQATYNRRLALYQSGGIAKKDLEASELALTTAENDLRLAESAAKLHQATTNPSNRAMAASRVKQAQDRLAGLDAQLSYAVIRAPFAGIITEQFQFEGEYVAAGAKLFTIADVSEMIAKAAVADTIAAQLKVGDEAAVMPQDLPGEELKGSISLVSRASNAQNRTVEIWVRLKNEGGRLRPDSAAKVVVSTNAESDAVIVPTSAVTLDATNADEGTVMVVDDQSIAHETKVTVGIRAGDRIQIASGLEGGETVIIEGNYALPDESKVEINEAGEGEEDKEEEGGAGAKEAAPSGAGKAPAEDGATKSGSGSDATPGKTEPEQKPAQSPPGSKTGPSTETKPGAKTASPPASSGAKTGAKP